MRSDAVEVSGYAGNGIIWLIKRQALFTAAAVPPL
jgi:hypothetical protein